MVIAGAGECRVRAAHALRQTGYPGPVTLVGAERHHPYERPPLSKTALDHGEPPALKAIASPERLSALDIALLAPMHAQAIDRGHRVLHLSGGTRLPYDALLLATGAMPRMLPMAAGLRRCVTLRTVDDAMAIRTHLRPGRRIAVIGRGFIGLEVAACARRAGADVTVIEAQPRILQRGVPGEIARVLQARHLAAGARIIGGEALAAMTETTDGLTITLSGGEDVRADLAVVGIAAALPGAAGLAIDNGVAADERLRTDDPHIYAAGDCCSFPFALYGGRRVRLEAWRNAQGQGALAAANRLGRDEVQTAVPWFWSDQYELGLQVSRIGRRDRRHRSTRSRHRRLHPVPLRVRWSSDRREHAGCQRCALHPDGCPGAGVGDHRRPVLRLAHPQSSTSTNRQPSFGRGSPMETTAFPARIGRSAAWASAPWALPAGSATNRKPTISARCTTRSIGG